MSALLCGKRTAFDELSSPGGSSAAISQKRARLRSGGSPSRHFAGTSGAAYSSAESKLAALRSIFPAMTEQELQRALEGCGHDLDLTIQNLNALCLASASEASKEAARAVPHGASRSHGSPEERARAEAPEPRCGSADGSTSAPSLAQAPEDGTAAGGRAGGPALGAERGLQGTASAAGQGVVEEDEGVASRSEAAAAAVSSVLSGEWVDAVVQEMMAARDLDDARQRAAGALQSFGTTVAQFAVQAKGQATRQLREQMLALQKENHILKRAVAIQHERHVAHEARESEVNNLKQMLVQYQEQMRKLEVSNYALNLHLQKSQVSNTMPGRFHPDVF